MGQESVSEFKFFSAGVAVWSLKLSNPGVGSRSPTKEQGLRMSGV